MHTTSLEAVAPPGWEKTVKKMKKQKDISNPFALAWFMHNQKFKPSKTEDADAEFDASLIVALRATRAGLPDSCYAAARGEAWAQAQLLASSGYGGPRIYQEARWR